MNPRQKELLNKIIKEYIKTAQPVGSHLLADKYFTNLSSATLRSDMNELEKQGYLIQPYTSAGRIPTEQGYRYYLKNFFADKKISKKNKRTLMQIRRLTKEYRQTLKNLAKVMAKLTGNAVIVGFAHQDVYYTGLANLFSQPEFQDIDFICNLSQIIDHLDKVIKQLFRQVTAQKIKILLGNDNPIDNNCGLIITNYCYNNNQGVIGILGPMRMNYEFNQALIKFVREILK